jgi:hypothetical protein
MIYFLKSSHPSFFMVNVDYRGLTLFLIDGDHRRVATLNLNDTKEGFLSKKITKSFL